MKMKLKIKDFLPILFILSLITIVPKISAAPPNNPIFATIAGVQQMISNALDSHEERILDLENRIENLENTPTPSGPSPTPTLVPVLTRYTSSPRYYSANEWGGSYCLIEHPTAVAGGWSPDPAPYPVGPNGLALPGATIGGSTYPIFPHYTFESSYFGETGFVLQNGGTGQTLTFWVDCV